MATLIEDERILPADHLLFFVKELAEHFSDIRKLKRILAEHEYLLGHLRGIPSTREEMLADWQYACCFLSLKVLEGNEMRLAQIAPDSYRFLEEAWLTGVKELKAYYIWQANNVISAEENYARGSDVIRKQLCNGEKGSPTQFDQIEEYLRVNYLRDGSVDIDDNKHGTKTLIARKAKRMSETTRNSNADANWFRARHYIRLFYENIIPAVRTNDATAARSVLEAFQFSKSPANRYLVINSFEAATAITFLDGDVIRDLVSGAACRYSMVPVDDWPKQLSFGESLQCKVWYDESDKQLICEGLLTEAEEEAITSQLTEPRHRHAVNCLGPQSRLKPVLGAIL